MYFLKVIFNLFKFQPLFKLNSSIFTQRKNKHPLNNPVSGCCVSFALYSLEVQKTPRLLWMKLCNNEIGGGTEMQAVG